MKQFHLTVLLLIFASCHIAPEKEEIYEQAEALVLEQDATAPLVSKDIKSFGAKGDGKTNDQAAFEKAAAYFNSRGGNGKLIISKGTYLVGKQTFSKGQAGQAAYQGSDVLHFTNVKNFTISGTGGARIKYAPGLRFGAFDPVTGKAFNHQPGYFVDYKYAAFIGHCIYFENSTSIKVEGLEIDGNNKSFKYGGTYGDTGRQLPHYGIFIRNCRQLVVSRMNVHHTALDGISVANAFPDQQPDQVEISDSKFEYNSRQGLSWIGGNGLKVKRCAFNHTGKAAMASAPGAGVDIEAEVSPITNGVFEECEFINNNGCGLVADSGESRNCTFTKCTFWGVTNWSVWVTKPKFTFVKCNIYGSFVHGFDAKDNNSATKFITCSFEDKAYNGKTPFGNFLIETNSRKRVSFDNCRFTANQQKLCWVEQPSYWKAEEKYQFKNCYFVVKNANYPQGDWVALIRGIRFKDCTFQFLHPDARNKGYWLNDCCHKPMNDDLGGNEVVYDATLKEWPG